MDAEAKRPHRQSAWNPPQSAIRWRTDVAQGTEVGSQAGARRSPERTRVLGAASAAGGADAATSASRPPAWWPSFSTITRDLAAMQRTPAASRPRRAISDVGTGRQVP